MPTNESIKENYLVHKNPMPLGVGVSELKNNKIKQRQN